MGIAIKEKIRNHLVRARLNVDFPRQSETVGSVDYTIRVDAPEDAQKVEVAVDQGEWRPCRRSSGYWWHDWSGYEDGEHEVVARLVCAHGKTVLSEAHEFVVAREKQTA